MRAIVYDAKPVGWVISRLLGGCIPSLRTSRLAGLSMVETPQPKLPADDWVRVRTLLGGICGTDLSLLAQRQPPWSILQAYSSRPIMLGHENVAVVEDVGPAVDPSWKGRRVCVEPTLSCVPRGIEPPCRNCRDGLFGACENFAASGEGKSRLPAGTSIGYNSATGGSYGEFFVAHQSQLVALGDDISDKQAVLTDPLACSLHAVLRADLSRAQRVLVYGSGMIGLGVMGSLRATGFSGAIDVVGRHAYLDSLARAQGASEVLHLPQSAAERFEAIAARSGGRVERVRFGNLALSGGYDAVFDCVGSRQSIEESLKWTTSRGQMVMVGTGHGWKVDLTALWFSELTVIGAYGRATERFGTTGVSPVDGIGTYQLVHMLMRQGKLKTDGLLTHKFELGDYRRAFEQAMNKSSVGMVRGAFDFRD